MHPLILLALVTVLAFEYACGFSGSTTVYGREKYLETLDLTFLMTNRFTHAAKSIAAETPQSAIDDALDHVPDEGTMFKSPAFKLFDYMFGIPVVHDVLFGVYRKQIVEKSEKMGLAWTDIMLEQWEALPRLSSLAAKLADPTLKIPDYYFAPIHAYKEGNLCWDSALEEDLWSKMMIAPLYDNALDGDIVMRRKWLEITGRVVTGHPTDATDLGCGTGLSMYMLDEKWPSLQRVTGVDLSTFKLAVCEEKKADMVESKRAKYTVRHEAAESTTVPSASQHLASLCLVTHESPRWVSERIFAEAYRILQPGGVFTILDLDKGNLENLLENPFVAAVYKRTEPYMAEYIALQPAEALRSAGFEVAAMENASRSHKVFVARKPEA